MRAVIGLVGILVVAGVFILWFQWGGGENLQSVAGAKKSAEQQTSQFAGKDVETGRAASESATIELIMSGGKPDSILVTKVSPGGAYEKYFGLKENDTILQIGPLPVKELVKSEDDAESFLLDAFQKRQTIIVARDGNQITLPVPPKPGAPPAGGQGSGTDPLQQQIDGIGARRGL
jgi:hypothetical protein